LKEPERGWNDGGELSIIILIFLGSKKLRPSLAW